MHKKWLPILSRWEPVGESSRNASTYVERDHRFRKRKSGLQDAPGHFNKLLRTEFALPGYILQYSSRSSLTAHLCDGPGGSREMKIHLD